jgi:hypothetical protein
MLLEDIIIKHSNIEQEIQEDLLRKTYTLIESKGGTVCGETIQLGGTPYRVLQQYIRAERTFITYLQPLINEQIIDTHRTTRQVDEIGAIRFIEICHPEQLTREANELADRLHKLLTVAYGALEIAVRSKLAEAEYGLVEHLYEIIDVALRANQHDEAVGKYWFTITKVGRQNEADQFRFYFNPQHLTCVINQLKDGDYQLLSPLEMLSHLLFTVAPDSGIEFYKEQKQTQVTLEVKHLLTAKGGEFQDFWYADGALINHPLLSFKYLCQSKGHLLAVASRHDYFALVEEACSSSISLITERFGQNVERIKSQYTHLVGVPTVNEVPVSKSVFISHSSADKKVVRQLAEDLKDRGLKVWFDQWEIKVGDSIVERIQEGISNNSFLIVVLSKNSVSSSWVKEEINAAFFKQVSDRDIKVIPVLIEDCDIPVLLRHRKYADLRKNYLSGLDDILTGISPETFELPLTQIEKLVLRENYIEGRRRWWANESTHYYYADKWYIEAAVHLEKLGLIKFESGECQGSMCDTIIERFCELTDLGRKKAENLFDPSELCKSYP